MNTNLSAIISKSMISVVVVFSLLASPSSVELVQASNNGEATNTRSRFQSASFSLDEGERYVALTVSQDEIANTTLLSFGYVFPDSKDSNLTIYITGNEGEIPNTAFTINSSSAQLTVTTPDSYPVTRCVVNNETGEYTCAPTGPSTFDLTWIKDDSWTFQGTSTTVTTSGSVMVRSRGRFDEVRAKVSGVWDGFSGINITGYLADNENATLIREMTMEANLPFVTPLALQARMEATPTLTNKANMREAFGFLYNHEGLNGLVRVWRDEITKTTLLRFGYAFPDPNDPARVLFFNGIGEIPNGTFTINSASAQLKVTTPDSLFIVYCVITDVIGNPGAYTCYPSPSPVTFDVTWMMDGYESVHETFMNVLTDGSLSTRYHLQSNRATAPVSGTWSEANEHVGTNMTGFLTNLQNVTLDKLSR